MTQEDRILLLKDLSARLPYGIKVNNEIQGDFKIYGICENFAFVRNEVCHIDFDIEKIKPYLFPLSSMTEEQDKEFALLQTSAGKDGFLYAWNCATMMKWLLENHFDYNGLIKKGLAIDATNKNIY